MPFTSVILIGENVATVWYGIHPFYFYGTQKGRGNLLSKKIFPRQKIKSFGAPFKSPFLLPMIHLIQQLPTHLPSVLL